MGIIFIIKEEGKALVLALFICVTLCVNVSLPLSLSSLSLFSLSLSFIRSPKAYPSSTPPTTYRFIHSPAQPSSRVFFLSLTNASMNPVIYALVRNSSTTHPLIHSPARQLFTDTPLTYPLTTNSFTHH